VAGDRVGDGTQPCLLLPGVSALGVQLGSYEAALAPAGKQGLGQSVMMLHPLCPLFMDKKMAGLTFYVCIPELGGFLFFSVSYF